MEGLVFHTPTTDVLRERGVFDRHPFQPYQGDAIYVRDLAAPDQQRLSDAYAADPLDALTPPLLGEKMTNRQYGSKFEEEPLMFLPSARVRQQVGATSERGRLARRVDQRIMR